MLLFLHYKNNICQFISKTFKHFFNIFILIKLLNNIKPGLWIPMIQMLILIIIIYYNAFMIWYKCTTNNTQNIFTYNTLNIFTYNTPNNIHLIKKYYQHKTQFSTQALSAQAA